MKNILKSVIIITIGLVICDIFIGYLGCVLSNKALERSPAKMEAEYAINTVNSDIVIIGSSRGRHHYVSNMIQDSLGMTVYNSSRDGSFYYYQLSMIDAILERYSPKMIIWNIEPHILTEEGALGCQTDLSLLLPLYGQNQFIDSLLRSKGYTEMIKLKSNMYRYNSTILSYVYNIIKPYHSTTNGYDQLPNNGYIYPHMTNKMRLYEDIININSVNMLNDIIAKCNDKGVNIVFSLSPFFQKTNYKDLESYQLLNKIACDNNIQIIDYYHDNNFMSDSTLFKDSFHLNDCGATVFTSCIIKELKKYNN